MSTIELEHKFVRTGCTTNAARCCRNLCGPKARREMIVDLAYKCIRDLEDTIQNPDMSFKTKRALINSTCDSLASKYVDNNTSWCKKLSNNFFSSLPLIFTLFITVIVIFAQMYYNKYLKLLDYQSVDEAILGAKFIVLWLVILSFFVLGFIKISKSSSYENHGYKNAMRLFSFIGLILFCYLQYLDFITMPGLSEKKMEEFKTNFNSIVFITDSYSQRVEIIQRRFLCCGIKGSNDYSKGYGNDNVDYPDSCFATQRAKQNNTPIDTGCLEKIKYFYEGDYRYVHVSLGIMGIFYLSFMALQGSYTLILENDPVKELLLALISTLHKHKGKDDIKDDEIDFALNKFLAAIITGSTIQATMTLTDYEFYMENMKKHEDIYKNRSMKL
ncbi:MAG: hypothetical protein MHPSP_001334 [Paramarteilia canceri]